MSRLMGAVVLVSLWASMPAHAQVEPAELAAACLGELESIEEAVVEEDTGRALVLLDLAGEACTSARTALISAIEAAPEGDEAALIVLWNMEMRRITLLEGMGSCDDARTAIRTISSEAVLPESLRTDFAQVSYLAMGCGPRPGVASGGTLTASPGMVDLNLSGLTTAEIPASDITGEYYCSGNIPSTPNYQLEVTAAMQVSLSAYSSSDLVLVVVGPLGEVYCNDDYDGLNPALSEWIGPGQFSIYVGEYSTSGYGADYSLTVSTAALTSTLYVYPTYGTASIGSGYGRTTLSGTVWGINEASTAFDATCAGWVAENPDFQIYVDYDSTTWVSVTGTTGTDLTLVIDGPSGRNCRDDTSGLNPAFDGLLTAGTYNVWVGDKAGPSTGASYGIQFSSYDPMIVLETTPTYGAVSMGPGSEDEVLAGTTDPVLPATDFFGTSCFGYISAAPSHQLTVTEGGMFEIVSRNAPSGYSDMILAVSGPGVTWCNDDYDGLNPGIRRYLQPGDYSIYVGDLSGGAYGTGPSPYQTTITATTGTPPPVIGTTGTFGNVTIGAGYGTTTLSGTAGGGVSADTFDSTCRGHVSEEPSFVMEVSGETSVSINVLAEGDTTLVLSGPDGVYCNDDNVGVNPGLNQYLSSGTYGVWIGTYSPGMATPFMVSFQASYY